MTRAITDFDHRGATELLLEAVDALNRDLQVTAPWQLVASDGPVDQAKLDALLVQYVVSARTIAAALAPVARRCRCGCSTSSTRRFAGTTRSAARSLAPALSSAALFGRARRDRETMAETHL